MKKGAINETKGIRHPKMKLFKSIITEDMPLPWNEH